MFTLRKTLLRLVIVIIILNVTSSIVAVHSLNLTQLIIPNFADRGSSVNLTCKFDLGGGRLYSIKWYKDEFEFFRYMPDLKPPTQVYTVSGVSLDLTYSGMNTVVLRDLTFNSSGTYSCEVSTEAPSYLTDVRKAKMTVIAFPKKNPQLEGTKPSYEDGEYVKVNCTASPSNPAPDVEWYINGAKAGHWLVLKYPTVYFAEDDIYTRSITLSLMAQKTLFQGVNSSLEIKCVALVPGLKPREKTAFLHLASELNNQQLAQERHGSSRGERGRRIGIILLVCSTLFSFIS